MKTKLTKGMLMTALICGTITVFPFSGAVAQAEEAAADDTALQGFTLEQIVVTATRTENKLIDTAANLSVVTAEEIEKKNYQSVSDALKDVPGVSVTYNGGEREKHVVLNGDDRVVIMIDGRRLNQEKGASGGHQAFDMSYLPSVDAIAKIEVLKGGASTLYGSDAVGGVINIITKTPEKTEVRLNVGGGSWGHEDYRAGVFAKTGRTGIMVTAEKERQSYVKYKDAKDSDTKRWKKSSSESDNVDVKLTQDIGKDQQATLYFHHSYKSGNQPAYIGSMVGSAGSDLNNDVSFQYDWGKNTDHAGYIRLYRNHYDGNYYSTPDNHYFETKKGIDIQQSLKISKNNNLTAGLEWRDSRIGSENYDGEKKIITKAIFLQDVWDFAPEWSLTVGDRYDKHNMFGHKNTLSAALNKKFGEKGHAYLTWGQVFRAPQGNDLYWYEDWGYGGMGLFGNPDLKPETGDAWTIGYSTAINDKTRIGISGFYSKLKDAIKWVDTTGFYHYECMNVDTEKKRGFEISVSHDLNKRLTVNASYAYVKSDIKTDGESNRDFKIAPNQYKFGISYQDDRFGAELMGRGASGQSGKEFADSKYLTMDLSLQYKIKKNWKVYANLYNLTNAAYTEYSHVTSDGRYQYPAPGRQFFIGTEYKF